MKTFEILVVHRMGTVSKLTVKDVSVFSCMRNASRHLLPFSWMEGEIINVEITLMDD